MGCCRAQYDSLAASTSAFSVLGQEMPSGSMPYPRAFGPQAQPAALGHLLTSDEKSLGFGATVV